MNEHVIRIVLSKKHVMFSIRFCISFYSPRIEYCPDQCVLHYQTENVEKLREQNYMNLPNSSSKKPPEIGGECIAKQERSLYSNKISLIKHGNNLFYRGHEYLIMFPIIPK